MKYFVFTCFIFFGADVFAQARAIEGLVKDRNNNFPLSAATITLEAANKTEMSDEFGKFVINNISPGSYNLIITSIGYRPVAVPVEVQNKSVAKLKIDLEPSSLNLSQVIITGKKIAALNTIAAVDIKLRPINTSQDILRIVPGLFIAQHAGGGKADQLFLRGYDIDHGTDIAETVDGMPVNMVSHAHGQGYADLHFVIPELIEKVNFDKGPDNTAKGNLATAGWVDFKTKDFLKTNTIKIEGGQFNYKRVTGLFKVFNRQRDYNRQQLYLASEYFKTDSYFDNPQNFHRFNLFGKYSVAFYNAQLFITASTFDSRWDASGQIPGRAVLNGMISRFGSIDSSEGGNTSRTNFNARFVKQHHNGIKTTDQVYFSNYHFNLFSNFSFFLNDSVNGDEINQQENRNLLGYTGTAAKEYFIGNKKSSSQIGYGVRNDIVDNAELNHVVKRIFLNAIEKGDINELNAFAFFNQEIELNHLNINAGIRFDHFKFGYKNIRAGDQGFHHQSKSVVSPKLNFTYTASKQLTLTLNSGIGFHSNDTRVILNNIARDILPKVFGTDAGFLLKPTKDILLKTTFWYLYSQQEFVYVGDEGIVEPAGRTRRTGIDLSGRYQPLQWLFFDVDLNYARPRSIDEPKGNNYVPLAPVFTSIGGISVKTKKGFSSSLRYRQMNERPANESNTVKTQGYFVADALANYTIKKIELSFSVENIFDTEWREAQFDTESRLQNETAPVSEIHYTPGTPRFIKLGIAYNF